MKTFIPLILIFTFYGCRGTSTGTYRDTVDANIDTNGISNITTNSLDTNLDISVNGTDIASEDFTTGKNGENLDYNVKRIRVENLEVAQDDFRDDFREEMNWEDATKVIEALGDGWRLPSKDELNTLYLNLDKCGLNDRRSYWSSTEDLNDHDLVWFQNFGTGDQYTNWKQKQHYIRAVRDFQGQTSYKYNVIGKPTIIGKLIFAQHDFPRKMKWKDAIKACESLGKGWRLPNKSELDILFEYFDKNDKGGFNYHYYWSSTEADNVGNANAWLQKFDFGYQGPSNKDNIHYVRAVKSL